MKITHLATLGMALEAYASPLQVRQASGVVTGNTGQSGQTSTLAGYVAPGAKSGPSAANAGQPTAGNGYDISGLLSQALTGGKSAGGSGDNIKGGSMLSSASSLGGMLGSPLNMLGDVTGMSTANDITKGGPCKPFALIFARGTGDPGGNMGFVVGPSLARAVRQAFGDKIAVQGAAYTANFLGGGADVMAKHVKDYSSRCPNAKFVLSGYSQGAMQVHGALSKLSGLGSKVAAIVVFGDPYGGFGSSGLSNVVGGLNGFNPANALAFCNNADPVCGLTPSLGSGSKIIAGGGFSHLGYRGDQSIPKAVEFLKTKLV